MIELKNAVYKGVSFLFLTAETTGGNRTIKFNYPGSGDQSIEVQGRAPRSFAMSIVLPHDGYYAARDELLRVLEDGEAGVLVHPTFGEVPNVINGKYTLVEELTKLGRATLTVTFDQDTAEGVPVEAAALPAQVGQQARETIAQALSTFEEGFDVSLNFPANARDATENVESVTDSLRAASRVAEPLASQAAAYNREINAFAGAVGNLIQAPADLAETIGNSFESLNNLFETPGETLGAFSTMFTFGDDDPVFAQNTTGRIERAANRRFVRGTVRTLALSYAYTAASQITYGTTAGLDTTISALEAAYVSIITENQTPNETQEQLDRLRVQAQAAFDVSRVNTRSVVTVTTPLRPLSVLVYDYYGSTDLVDTIAELNNIKQNAFVEGEIKVLTA